LQTRFVDTQKIIEAIDFGLQHTNKIALLGVMLRDILILTRFWNYKKKNAQKPVELTLSSLRADLTSDNVVKTLVDAGENRHNCN
jgi:hypothetical protein